MKTASIVVLGIMFAGAVQVANSAPPPDKPLNTNLPPSSVPPAAGTAHAPATHDARGDSAPHVTVKTQGDKVIEAYSRGGHVYMVKVTPKHGVPYTYRVNGNGALEPENGAPPVTPAMYTVLQWGAPPAQKNGDNDNDGG